MKAIENTLTKIVANDQVAFGKLFNFYKEPCKKFIFSIIKDEEEAKNIIQDVFVKFWNRRALINPTLNFNSYLYTSLRNMAFDYLKKVEKNQILQEQYYQNMIHLEAEPDVEETKIYLLRKVMAKLPAKRKMILVLNIEEGKSYQEIAEKMHISKNTVKNQLVKAKQFVRDGVNLSLAY